MTLQINSADSICGVPIIRVRDALKRLGSSPSLSFGFEFFESLGLKPHEARVLGQKLVDRGYLSLQVKAFDVSSYKLSSDGRRFAKSSAATRIKRKTADLAIKELIRRVIALNESTEFLVTVTGLVVFGSYLGIQRDLGDVDIGWTLACRFPEDSAEQWHARRANHFENSGRSAASFLDELSWPERQAELFLKNRKRSISLHRFAELAGLAAQNPDFAYEVLYGDTTTIAKAIGIPESNKTYPL